MTKTSILENEFAEEGTDYKVLAIKGENYKGAGHHQIKGFIEERYKPNTLLAG